MIHTHLTSSTTPIRSPVLPLLKYRQRNELTTMLATKDEMARVEELRAAKGGVSRKSSFAEGFDEAEEAAEAEEAERSLRRRVTMEEEYNGDFIAQVEGGQHKATVRYGGVVQLQHVSSGLFVTAQHGAATFDPECRGITLAPGSSAACFRFMPRFKAQTVGSPVYFGDNMIIESTLLLENFLHTSE